MLFIGTPSVTLARLFGMVEEDARAKAFHYYNNQFSKSSRSIGKFLRVQFDENATQVTVLHRGAGEGKEAMGKEGRGVAPAGAGRGGAGGARRPPARHCVVSAGFYGNERTGEGMRKEGRRNGKEGRRNGKEGRKEWEGR